MKCTVKKWKTSSADVMEVGGVDDLGEEFVDHDSFAESISISGVSIFPHVVIQCNKERNAFHYLIRCILTMHLDRHAFQE
jgi:hypothetical protein